MRVRAGMFSNAGHDQRRLAGAVQDVPGVRRRSIARRAVRPRPNKSFQPRSLWKATKLQRQSIPSFNGVEIDMLLTRTAQPTRTVDLGSFVKSLTAEFPTIREVYLFGSRRYRTGSVRSDIDLLLVTQDDQLDYHLPRRVREVEAYIDAFQAIGGTAISLANHSQIIALDRAELLSELSAVVLWTSSDGWCGDAVHSEQDVLRGSVPQYTRAQFENGTIDPAECFADIVVVTALQKEYAAVCARLEKLPNAERVILDEGELFTIDYSDGDERKVVVVRATRMGPVAAALQTLLAIEQWSPQLVLLAGIAAGIEGEGVQLGDILVPDRLVEYEAVKVENDGSRFHGIIPAPSAAHARRIEQWPGLSSWLKKRGAMLPEPTESITVRTDAMASGEKVVASEDILTKIKGLSRKVCAVEMEAIGVAEACTVLPSPTPYLVIKAVTDLANAEKDDRYHVVASESVADLIAELIEARRLV